MVGNARCALAIVAGCGLIAALGTGCGNRLVGGSQSGDTITLGAILSLSGTFSTLGPPQKTAMEMGTTAVNAAGGVTVGGKKYKVKVKVIDDKSDVGLAGVAAYRQLAVVDKVPALAIGLGTSNYQSVIERNPLPVLNILDSTYPSILRYSDQLFLVRTATPGYAPGCTWYAKNVLKADRIAIIGSSASTYSAGLETWVEKSADFYGVKVSAHTNYPAGTTDFSSFIQKAMASHPQAIYLGGVTGEVDGLRLGLHRLLDEG
ncbi:ABC transporter substrate-binding protein [Streptomyces sp. NPDC091280]|uniref:ABC transporter substrate-binding protein n=1 Tax=Streptomyces sp. NPDC091280 TaxID=3365984 RepID=UPI0038228421